MKTLKQYLLRGTPSLLLPLGAGFVMASSSNMKAALGMGAVVILSTVLSAIVISAIRNIIPKKTQLPIYILILSGFVSIIHMIMDVYFIEIVNMLGVHLAAVAVSAVPYRHLEEISGVSGEKKAILSALITGLFFAVIMVLCALFREIFGSGSFFGIQIKFLSNYKISALSGVFGGYLILALVLAVIRKIGEKIDIKEECD